MTRFDGELIENLGRYRKYNQSSLRDLLRVIRNKHNHFRELPESLQAKLGPLPRGYHSCVLPSRPSLADSARFNITFTAHILTSCLQPAQRGPPLPCRHLLVFLHDTHATCSGLAHHMRSTPEDEGFRGH